MKNSIFLAVALALGTGAVLPAGAAAQGNARAVRATAQANMLLTGSVDISAEGTVEGYRLDHPEKVPGYVQDYLRPIISGWRFEPGRAAGKAVPAVAPMRLLLNGKRTEDGGLEMALESAGFRTYEENDPTGVGGIRMTPPAYPPAAYTVGGAGEVMLLVKINREGKTEDVISERVDLRVAGDERSMQRIRDILAKASMAAARRWSFRIPTEGPAKDDASWVVRIPVNFDLDTTDSRGDKRYGQWTAFIPGPRQRAPWLEDADAAAQDELLPDRGVFLAGVQKGPKLLTPVGG